jgi:hypothetical protein
VPAHFPLTSGLTAAIDSIGSPASGLAWRTRTVQKPDAAEECRWLPAPAIRAKNYDAYNLHEPAGP